MKDTEARNMIRRIAAAEFRGRTLLGRLENLSVKNCPKCKHPVLARHNSEGAEYVAPNYQCLTCGSKFICSNECVCKLIEEEK